MVGCGGVVLRVYGSGYGGVWGEFVVVEVALVAAVHLLLRSKQASAAVAAEAAVVVMAAVAVVVAVANPSV